MVALENIFFALSIVLFVVTSGYILYTCTRTEMFRDKEGRERENGRRDEPVIVTSVVPSPSPSPASVSSPIFVTSAIASSPSLPVGGSAYQLVTSIPSPAPATVYQPKNPPYQQVEETQPTLSTTQGPRAGGLQTGFVEKPVSETVPETKAIPVEGKMASTPAPLEETRSQKESMVDTLVKNNHCVQQFLGSCMKKETLLETTSFVILETDTQDQIYFGIPKELASIYTTGIELTRKEYSTSVKNKTIPFPYTILKTTVPVGYSVFFKTTEAVTDAISVSNSADGGKENVLQTPVVVDPSKYSSVSMIIIPKST